jgi:predicted DNA-binding transcriptional regulator AlpA
MSEEDSNKLLTRAEVMKMLNCCKRTIRRLEVSGKLPRVQLTQRFIRYRKKDIMRLIDKSVVKQAAW